MGGRGASIPYSFVTAIDRFFPPLGGIEGGFGRELTDNDVILSDYAARRLNASVGDTVMMSFFVSEGLKVLTEEQHPFVVRDIMPLQMFQADGRLSADFPGLSNVDNCTDWDSDLPIDMTRIEKEDED
jgi:putative ABC transport system permease protein